jgi:hypothetical protein
MEIAAVPIIVARCRFVACVLALPVAIACGQVADDRRAESGVPDSAVDSEIAEAIVDTNPDVFDTEMVTDTTATPDANVCGPIELGAGVTELAQTTNVHSIVVRDGVVYWTDILAGRIYSVPASGGCPTLLVSGQAHPWTITFEGDRLVWTNCGSCTGVHDGSLASALPDGSGLFTIGDKQIRPTSLVADKTTLYWTTLPEDATEFDLWRDEGGPKGVSLDPADAVAINSAFVYWVGNLNTVERQSRSTHVTETISSTEKLVNSIVMDEEFVFWNEIGDLPSSGTVVAHEIATGARTELATKLNEPRTLVLDERFLYWGTRDGEVVGYDRSAHTTRVLGSIKVGLPTIASDGTHIYWSDYNRIYRVAL